MKFKRTVLSVSISSMMIALAGCGGGGGGGGGAGGGGGYLRAEVPYHTPVRVATVDPLVKVDGAAVVGEALLKIEACIKTVGTLVVQERIADKLLGIDAGGKAIVAFFVI